MSKKAISIEALFVMILFMVFTIAMVIMILSGRHSYDNILSEKKYTEEIRITTSYFRMKLKQNDQTSAIKINHDDKLNVNLLEIYHSGENSQDKTVMYYYDGRIWEAYIGANSEFEPELATTIIEVPVEDVRFNLINNGIEILYQLDKKELKQFVALQSEGE